jgi:hypothetical protein
MRAGPCSVLAFTLVGPRWAIPRVRCCPLTRMRAVARQIDRAELEAALKGLDLYTTKEAFETIFLQLDKDGSGCLDFDEFTALAKLTEASRKVIDLIPLEEVEEVESDEVSAENDNEAQVRILTKEDGKNRGRAYVYNMPSQDSAIWVASLKLAVKEAYSQ